MEEVGGTSLEERDGAQSPGRGGQEGRRGSALPAWEGTAGEPGPTGWQDLGAEARERPLGRGERLRAGNAGFL